jgi:hypothetical protein
MLRYLLTGMLLLALGFSVSRAAYAQQQPPSGMHSPMGEVSGRMPLPPLGRMGVGQGLSGSFPNGIQQDGPRAGLPPLGPSDGHKKPQMPRVRPQYTPGGAMPAVPQDTGSGQ